MPITGFGRVVAVQVDLSNCPADQEAVDDAVASRTGKQESGLTSRKKSC